MLKFQYINRRFEMWYKKLEDNSKKLNAQLEKEGWALQYEYDRLILFSWICTRLRKKIDKKIVEMKK